jgi:hypothetical protein
MIIIHKKHGRARRRWEDKIKTNLQEVGCESMDWNDLTECGNEPSGSIQCGKFLD